MDFIERIDFCLMQKNLKRAALCEEIGTASNAVSDWKRRGTIPAADIVLKMSKIFDVSVEWLVTGEETKKPELSSEEKRFLNMFRQLNTDQLDTIFTLMETFISKNSSASEMVSG